MVCRYVAGGETPASSPSLETPKLRKWRLVQDFTHPIGCDYHLFKQSEAESRLVGYRWQRYVDLRSDKFVTM